MYNFPNQKKTLKEKLARDKATDTTWGEDCVEYLIANSGLYEDYEEFGRLKNLVDGSITDKDYDYVLNPLNTTIDRYKRFGAKLRNLNIISPVRDLYLGEFGKRFKNIQVMESNPHEDNLYKEGLNQVLKNYYTQKAINELNTLGVNTGEETTEQGTREEVETEYKRQFDTNRVITGQETLDFIIYDKDLDDVYQDVYEDWIIYGRAITYKGIFYNDLDFEHVPAEQIAFPKNLKSNFIEDGAWAVRREILQPFQILDKFREDIKKENNSGEILEWLAEQGSQGDITTSGRMVFMPTEYISNNEEYKRHSLFNEFDGLVLHHCVWRSWRKIGILKYKDLLGEIQEKEVDETYKFDKGNGDISIEWEWQSQIWEGRDIEGKFKFGIRPLPYNRMELNNSSVQKLPYNGRVLKGYKGSIRSIVKTGEPYQILHNILSYQREKTINKNKDKIVLLPQGLIPKGRDGWDEEKFMYFADANSLGIIDESSPNASFSMQAVKVLDMSLGTYIRELTGLMQEIKNDWWDSIGMNRQRYGDTKASDGKGVTEQAIFRSAVISEELNRKFEKFQEKDYQGLLDLSKLAYINGKKGHYINSEQRKALLAILPEDALYRLETDYNLFVKNSTQENEKLETLKQYAFSYAQNGGGTDILMEMLDTTNFTKGKEVIKKMEEAKQKRDEALQREQNETLAEIENGKRESEQKERDVKVYEADTKYDSVIDKALLEMGKEDNIDNNNEDLPDSETIRMNNHAIKQDAIKNALDRREQKRKERETSAKIKNLNAPKVNSK